MSDSSVSHRSDGNSEARPATPAELEAAGIDPITAVISAAKSRPDDEQVQALLAQLEAVEDREGPVFLEGLADLRRMLERADIVPPERPPEGSSAGAVLGRIQPVQRVDVGQVPAPFVAGAGVQVQHLGRVASHMNQAGITVQHVGGSRPAQADAALGALVAAREAAAAMERPPDVLAVFLGHVGAVAELCRGNAGVPSNVRAAADVLLEAIETALSERAEDPE